MSNFIFFIGGASGSGKSFTVKQIADGLNKQVQKLDDIYNKYRVKYGKGTQSHYLTFQESEQLIRELINTNQHHIVEGGWITVETANALRKEFGKRFIPVFVGYPKDTVQNRIEFIRNGSTPHWLQDLIKNNAKLDDGSKAEQWIEEQIKGSISYEKACKKAGIKFIDFTIPKNGAEALELFYNNILEPFNKEYIIGSFVFQNVGEGCLLSKYYNGSTEGPFVESCKLQSKEIPDDLFEGVYNDIWIEDNNININTALIISLGPTGNTYELRWKSDGNEIFHGQGMIYNNLLIGAYWEC